LEAEKAYDFDYSKKRSVIEHIILRIKKCGIMNDSFRNRIGNYNWVSDVA
jgi:hypothetical protein